jgi:DNA-directed RNA polymerase specialized sigma24 family protein
VSSEPKSLTLQARAQQVELELVGKAHDAVSAAEAHRDEICREVLTRKVVTQDQVAEALGITARALRSRLAKGAP